MSLDTIISSTAPSAAALPFEPPNPSSEPVSEAQNGTAIPSKPAPPATSPSSTALATVQAPDQSISTAAAAAPPGKLRSWRKKYKKLKVRFDMAMGESNRLFKDEKNHLSRCRRIQEDIDGLLDALMALREEHIAQPNPALEEIIVTSGGLQVPEGHTTVEKDRRQLDTSRYMTELVEPFPAILRRAYSNVPTDGTDRPASFHSYSAADVWGEKDIKLTPSNYFDPVYEAEYLDGLDPQLEDPDVFDDVQTHVMRVPPSRVLPSDRDLASQNQDSVVSWLKRNHPESFIQQAEKDREHAKDTTTSRDAHHNHHSNNHNHNHNHSHHSDAEDGTGAKRESTSHSKPGNKRAAGPAGGGGGKRQSIKAEPTEEMYDDEGFPLELPEKPKKGRARADDQSYRPKGGGTKGKRKRESGPAGGEQSGNRGKRVKSTTGPVNVALAG